MSKQLIPKLLLDWWQEPVPTAEYLIDGILPTDSVVIVSGPPKRGFKTWLAMLMAGCVATGKDYKVFKPRAPEPVLFVEEEGGLHGTRKRLSKVFSMLEVDLDDPTTTKEGVLAQKNFWWLRSPRLKLDNMLQVAQLKKFIEAHGIKLVVLDAITYMHSGDENNKQDMQKVCDALGALRATGATIVALMHVNRSSRKENVDIDLGTRGSSVFTDYYDVHFGLRRDKTTDALTLEIRSRDYEPQEYTLFWNVTEGVAQPELIIKPRDEGVIAEEFVAVLRNKGFPAGRAITPKDFQAVLGLTAGKAAEIRAQLINEGKLTLVPGSKDVMIPKEKTYAKTTTNPSGAVENSGNGVAPGSDVVRPGSVPESDRNR